MACIALGLGVSQVPGLGDWMADGVFLILAAITIVSAAASPRWTAWPRSAG